MADRAKELKRFSYDRRQQELRSMFEDICRRSNGRLITTKKSKGKTEIVEKR